MISDYKARKAKEIELLNEILGDKKVLNKIDFNKFYKIKKIKQQLLPLTKYENINMNDYDYTYKRFDGNIKKDDFPSTFYDINIYTNSVTLFTNCAMSSITSLILSLSMLNYEVVMSDNCYFEAYRICKLFNKKNNKKVLYIDSIDNDFELTLPEEIEKYKLIVVDTTCLMPTELKTFVKKVKYTNKPIILIRSHTKLDLLGTEYTHIGSTIYLYENDSQKELELIKEKQKLMISSNGCFLDILDFPDFMTDKRIMKCCEERTKTIMNNSELIYNLSNKNFILPNHKLFCLKKKYILNETLGNLREKLKKELSGQKQIKYSVSFALDYTAIDVYSTSNENEYIYRISPSDFDEHTIKEQFSLIDKILK